MSTKRTLTFQQDERFLKGKKPKSPPFHLFTDCSDDQNPATKGKIYLELTGDVDFAAGSHFICVGIPPAIWNRIVEVGRIKVTKGEKNPDFPDTKHPIPFGN